VKKELKKTLSWETSMRKKKGEEFNIGLEVRRGMQTVQGPQKVRERRSFTGGG